jgi:hypothetical protein
MLEVDQYLRMGAVSISGGCLQIWRVATNTESRTADKLLSSEMGQGVGGTIILRKMFSYKNESLNRMDFMAGPRRHFERNIPDLQ